MQRRKRFPGCSKWHILPFWKLSRWVDWRTCAKLLASLSDALRSEVEKMLDQFARDPAVVAMGGHAVTVVRNDEHDAAHLRRSARYERASTC